MDPAETVRSQFRNVNFPFPHPTAATQNSTAIPVKHVVARPARHAPHQASRCRVTAGQNRADPPTPAATDPMLPAETNTYLIERLAPYLYAVYMIYMRFI